MSLMTKEARICSGEMPVSSMSEFGKTVQIHNKTIKLDHSFTPHTKLNPK